MPRLRRLLKVLAILFAGLVFAVGALVAALQFPGVQRRIIEEVETLASDAFNGRLEIGELKGSIFGEPTFERFALRDAEGRALVSADAITVDVAWGESIARRQIFIESATIQRPRVWFEVDEHGNSFSRLSKNPKTNTSTATTFSPIPIVIQHGELIDGELLIEPVGEPIRASDINATLSGRVDKTEIPLDISSLGVTSPLLLARTTASGTLRIEPEALYSSATATDALGTRLVANELKLVYEGLGLEAAYAATVPRETIAHLLPQLRIAADLDGRVEHAPDADWRITGSGHLGAAPLAVDVTASDTFESLAGTVNAGPNVDLSAFGSALPESSLRIDADFDLEDLTRPTGRIDAVVSGRVEAHTAPRPIEVQRLALQATLTEGVFVAEAELQAIGAWLDGTARGRIGAEGLSLASASVALDVDRLGAIVGSVADVQGHVSGRVQFDGPIASPAITTELDTRNVRFGSLHVGQAKVDARVEGPFVEPTGTVVISAQNVVVAEESLGSIDVDAKRDSRDKPAIVNVSASGGKVLEEAAAIFAVSFDQGTVSAKVRLFRAAAFGSSWSINNGADVRFVDGLLTVADLTVATGDTRATIDTKIDLERQAIVALDVDVPELHLNALRRAGFLKDGKGDVATSMHARLEGDVLVVEASVFGPVLGRGTISARVEPPKRALDPLAWQRLDLEDIRKATVRLFRLDVGVALTAIGFEPMVRGPASGHLVVDAGHITRGSLDFSDARIEGISKDLTVLASIQKADDAWARGRISALLGTTPVLSATAKVVVDERRLSEKGIVALAEANFDVDAKLDAFPLDTITVFPQLEGIVTGTIAASRRGTRLALDTSAMATDVRWDRRWPRMDFDMDGRLKDRQMTLDVDLDALEAGQVRLAARAQAPIGAARLAAWSNFAILDIVEFDLDASGADLALWSDLFGVEGLVGFADAQVDVKRGGRLGEAAVALRGLSVPGATQPIDGRVYASTNEARTYADASLFRGGRLLLSANAKTPRSAARILRMTPEQMTEMAVDGELRAPELPMSMIAEALDAAESVDGNVALFGYLNGTLADPQFVVDLTSDHLRVGRATMTSVLVEVVLKKDVLVGDILLRQGETSSLETSGRIELTGDQQFAINLEATEFDLAVFSLLSQAASATFGGVLGRLDGEMLVAGTPDDPRADGRLAIKNARAVLVHPVPPLNDINGMLTFERDSMKVDLEGSSGEGTFTMVGEGTLTKRGFEMTSRLDVEKVAVAAGPKILRTDLDAEIELLISDRIDVDVLVREGDIRLPSGSEQRIPIEELEHVVLVDNLSEEPPERPKNGAGSTKAAFPYRVQIRTAGRVPIRSTDINANVVADVTVSELDGSGEMSMAGFVEVTSGTISLFGRQWVIDVADLRLAEGAREQPRLDIRVRHDFPDATVFVSVTGSPLEPNVRFRSDPPIYSQDQLLGFVLGGTPNSSRRDAPLADEAAGAAAGFLLGEVRTKLQDKLPIDTLAVELDDAAGTQAVTVGKWITSRLFVAYNHRIGVENDENVNAGLVQLRLGRGWMLETTYGDRGNGSADVLYRKRF